MLGQWCSSTEPQLAAPHQPAQGWRRAKTPPCPIPVWTVGRSCLPRARIAGGDPCPTAYGPQDRVKMADFCYIPGSAAVLLSEDNRLEGSQDDPDQQSQGESATADDRPARRA